MKSRVPDYYALLQVSPGACQSEVINGYRHAKQAYHQGSLAVYTLFSDDDLHEIEAEIEEAYRTLSDPERRRNYDQLYKKRKQKQKRSWPAEGNVVPLHRHSQTHHEASGHIAMITFSGKELRQAREEKGISLEAISAHTKISMHYLHAIEEEQVDRFPESPYLKGYIRQYCHEIGVDAEPVVRHFMALIGPA